MVLLLVIGEILCYAGQEFFAKLFSISHPGKAADVNPIFSVFFGGIVAIATWIYGGFAFDPDWITIVIGVANGIALYMYNLSVIHAAQCGPYTLQSIMCSFGNILLPLAASLIVWGDRLRAVQGVGIVLMLAAFVIYNGSDMRGMNFRFKGFGWFVMAFVMNGVYSTLNDAHGRIEAGTHRTDMIILCFATTAIISLVRLLASRNPDVRKAVHMPRNALIYAIADGISAAAAINLLLAALHYVPSYLLYPIGSGTLLVLNTVLSRIVLKEKILRLQYIGLAVAVMAIVLTNM